MLRVKDLALERGELTVRRGKGGKDRVSVIPETVRKPLVEHLGRVKELHTRDVAEGGGWVEMPGGLDVKYPKAGSSWPWQWVFPARRSYWDSETGHVRRHHLHESVVQRAMTAAVRASGIGKRATCHTLRHSSTRCCTRERGIPGCRTCAPTNHGLRGHRSFRFRGTSGLTRACSRQAGGAPASAWAAPSGVAAKET